MAAPQHLPLTAQEYLARERAALDVKSEFWGGDIVAMSGAKVPHIRIVGNLFFSLRSQLRDGPCDVYSNDLRVAADPSGKYFYPDVVIACQDAQFLDSELDTLLNPVVIIEVLSPSTEAIDRTVKLDAYREIPSLMHYVLVDSRCMAVDHYSREGSATWLLTALHREEEGLTLTAIGATTTLQQIYDTVQFADAT